MAINLMLLLILALGANSRKRIGKWIFTKSSYVYDHAKSVKIFCWASCYLEQSYDK
jgi:hypothetical protein